MARSGMTSDSQKRSRATSILLIFAASLSIMLTPFVKFLTLRDYGFAHLEVAILFVFPCAAALLLTILISLRPETLKPALFGLLVFAFLYSELRPLILEFINGWSLMAVNETPVLVSIALLMFAAIIGLAWMLRENIDIIITTFFGVIMVSTVMFSSKPPATWNIRNGPQITADRSLPPVVHIILDEQIGINGLPKEITDGKELREDLRGFYKKYGFTLYPRAFTHFWKSIESIPNLLNQKVEPEAFKALTLYDDFNLLTENAWFDKLAKAGYSIDVFQTHYLDYCGKPGTSIAPINKCSSYNVSDVRFFHGMDIPYATKGKLLFDYIIKVDFEDFLLVALLLYQRLREALGPAFPEWNFQSISPSPLVSMEAVSKLTERISSLKNGEAVFAHIILPHNPYVFDRQCRLLDVSDWVVRSTDQRVGFPWGALWRVNVSNTPEYWAFRYHAYLEQVRCIHAKLGEIFDVMHERGTYERSTIIIHGDHGSRIGTFHVNANNEKTITERDLIANYSTLFAVKKAGLAPGEDMDQRSIQDLFAELLMEKKGIKTHGDIFFKPNKNAVGPDQIRLPMVTMRP